tara:strand:+ start:126 stop:1235 length:1110 start_codon:yes stop_codon:yes gene_type:complete
MSKTEDDGLKDLLDPKSLLEQLRECETKQFKSAIDLLQECEERHRRNEKKLSRLTIAASAGGALVGQEAVQEVGQIVGVIDGVVSGDTEAISEAASGIGLDPAAMGMQVGPNGEIVFPGLGGFGFGGGGVGANGGAGTGFGVNPEKATPTTEDDEDSKDEDEEKGKKNKDQEEEAEEEEEESEEESEEEEESEDEEEDEDEDEEEDEEEEQEEQQEDEQEQEQEQDTPEPDPPSSDQSASIPSLPDNTEETILKDFFEEALALTEMEKIDALLDTPNIIEDIPAILRSRRPDTSDEVVGIDESNNQPPPIVIDEEVEVDGIVESVEVPASPVDPYVPPMQEANIIPAPGFLSILIVFGLLTMGSRLRVD